MKKKFNIPTLSEVISRGFSGEIKTVYPEMSQPNWDAFHKIKDEPICERKDIRSFHHDYYDYNYAVVDLVPYSQIGVFNISAPCKLLLIFEDTEVVAMFIDFKKFFIFRDVIIVIDHVFRKTFHLKSMNVFNNQPIYRGTWGKSSGFGFGISDHFVDDAEFEFKISSDGDYLICTELSTGFTAEFDVTMNSNREPKKIIRPIHSAVIERFEI